MITDIVKNDMTPSLGVTEPGAIAYAGAVARTLVGGDIVQIELQLNSGIYKNSFTCGIPNSDKLGCLYAAALGVIGGDAGKKLEALTGITKEDNERAERLVNNGMVSAKLKIISPEIMIDFLLITTEGNARVVIKGQHDHIARMEHNNSCIFSDDIEPDKQRYVSDEICKYSVLDIYDFCLQENALKLGFLRDAYNVDMALFEQGRTAGLLSITSGICGGLGNAKLTAHEAARLYTCGAIEARVRGASHSAMAITGSGSHGILCVMPVFASGMAWGLSEERILRAALFSCAITMYIKAYSGRLSAMCGCVAAGGTGAALGIIMLRELGFNGVCHGINSMTSSLAGMICHGGNPGCVMKALAAIDMMFNALALAECGVSVEPIHGILDKLPDRTLKNLGRISSPGMLATESTIIDILAEKQ